MAQADAALNHAAGGPARRVIMHKGSPSHLGLPFSFPSPETSIRVSDFHPNGVHDLRYDGSKYNKSK